MEWLVTLLQTLNSLSPLGVIALLGVVIFMMVKGKTAADQKVETLANNHLHEMPELASNMKETVEILRRIEIKLGTDFAYIKAKLGNGGGH